MTESPRALLGAWLRRQLSETELGWLEERLAMLDAEPGERELHVTLGMAPRRLGKADLILEEADLAAAGRARAGWDPRGWSVDVAARVLALLAAADGGRAFAERFRALCRSADVAEAVALYRGLPLYPEQESLESQAAEGVRTNMRAVFEAVAHRNPFPRERFDQNRWNQMVLKALFIGSSLAPIQGLDARANAGLAEILRDYAHERWAAGRPVSPELWRCVGPFALGAALADLERALASPDERERQGAALALAASPAGDARALLATAAALSSRIEHGDLTWDRLSANR